MCWWLSRCWRAPHNFGRNCRGRSEVLGLTLRNFLAPFQRLPDDFAFVRAGEFLQKSLATFLINERSEPTALRTAPGVQLDRKVAVINAALKRWRIPQLLRVTDTRYRPQANKLVESGKKAGMHDRFIILDHAIVYSVGHSLKDLGSKDTVLNKTPDRASIIKLFQERWEAAEISI